MILKDHDNSPLVNVHHSIIETVLLKDLELLQLGENRLPQTSVASRVCQPKTMARRINKDSAVRMVNRVSSFCTTFLSGFESLLFYKLVLAIELKIAYWLGIWVKVILMFNIEAVFLIKQPNELTE